jgi:hypothetical protein
MPRKPRRIRAGRTGLNRLTAGELAFLKGEDLPDDLPADDIERWKLFSLQCGCSSGVGPDDEELIRDYGVHFGRSLIQYREERELERKRLSGGGFQPK